MTLLANAWVGAGHEVVMVTFEDRSDGSAYVLDPRINVRPLKLQRRRRTIASFAAGNARRIRCLRRVFAEAVPDIVVAFTTEMNVLALVASRGLGLPVAVAERTHPEYHPIGRVRGFLRARTYPSANLIVVQSDDVACWVERRLRLTATVIPNPIDAEAFVAEARGPFASERKRLLAMGRLTWEKGHDVLIQAFARLAADFPEWDLVIVGAGPEEEKLEAMVGRCGLGDRIRLDGPTDDVARELAAATVFVHPSWYEGYPNAVMEALAAGCCVVASDCPGGTRELLRDGTYGIMAQPGDPESLADALQRAMGEPDLRADLRKRAPLALVGLDVATISGRWIAALEKVCVTARPASRA